MFVRFFVTLFAAVSVEAATAYSWSLATTGYNPSRGGGMAVVDGKRWVIRSEHVPGEVSTLDRIVGGEGRELVAINDENQTWFRLPKWNTNGSMLYRFGMPGSEMKISKLKITPATDGALTRIVFSYRFETKWINETLRGQVWGEMRVRSGAAPLPAELPWTPIGVIATDVEELDRAFQEVLAPLAASATQFELDISRKIDGGAVLKQTGVRTIGELHPVTVKESDFKVPEGYRYQEPVIGAPGVTSGM